VWFLAPKPLPMSATSPPGSAAAGFTLSILGTPFIFTGSSHSIVHS
jgi:hypothetical protein